MSGEVALPRLGIIAGSMLTPFGTLLLILTSQIALGVPRAGSQKEVANKHPQQYYSVGQIAPNWDTEVVRLVVFSVYFQKILPNYF